MLSARQDKSFIIEKLVTPADDRGDITDNDVMVGIIPTDFNGDAEMDILVLTKDKSKLNGPVMLTIFWGKYDSKLKTLSLDSPETLAWKLKDDPLLFE